MGDLQHPAPATALRQRRGVRGEMLPTFLDLVDRLYDAALNADRWPAFLRAAADLFRADNSYVSGIEHTEQRLFYVVLDEHRWEDIPLRRFVVLMDEDPRMPAFRTTKFEPLHCRMVAREADLHASRVYNEALSILGIEYSLVVNLDEDCGVTRYLGLTRERTREPFDAADCALLAEMVPHLRRALSIRSELERLDRERAITTETLNQLPVGVLVVDPSCRVRGINTTARDVIASGTGIRLIDGCVSAEDGGDHSRLMGAIGRALGAEEERPTPAEVLSLNAAKGGEPLVVLVSGLSVGRLRRGLHVAEDELVTLLTNEPVVWQQKQRDWLRRLYGLTPSQSRLAGLMARGASLKDAARRLGLTEGSARQYLKIIFRKTGTNRQADLVRRLNAVPMGHLGSADTERRDAVGW